MEILYRGTPPEQRQYDATCTSCYTRIRFVQSEAELRSSVRNERYLEVECPVCGKAIFKEI